MCKASLELRPLKLAPLPHLFIKRNLNGDQNKAHVKTKLSRPLQQRHEGLKTVHKDQRNKPILILMFIGWSINEKGPIARIRNMDIMIVSRFSFGFGEVNIETWKLFVMKCVVRVRLIPLAMVLYHPLILPAKRWKLKRIRRGYSQQP